MTLELKELVLGLHWHPPISGASPPAPNLDARCLLFDAQERVVEVIQPGRLSNANGSVLHTGDSRTGASEWDDERIFVFLEALPGEVSGLAFVVASADGKPFGDVPGASCHLSDRLTEQEWLRVDLTALRRRKHHRVARVRRGPAGWRIEAGAGRERSRAC